jgi:tripartite ATP-independent transporter DctP family solute receptor
MTSKLVALAVLLAAAVLLAGPPPPAPEAQTAKYKIRLGNSQGAGETTADTMIEFKKEVEAKSGGQIQVELYPSGQLGKVEEVVEMLRSAAVQIHINSPQYLAKWYPEIQVTSLPYLFDSPESADRTLDGPFGVELKAKIQEKTDFVIMGYEEYGLKHVFNRRRPVKTIEDLRGLKLRVIASPVTLKTFQSLGASPVGMAFSEIYSAMQTGVIDGGELPFTSILGAKLFEVTRYISTTGHFFELALVVGSKSWLATLPPDMRKIVMEAAENMATIARRTSRASQATARAFMVGKGVEVNDVAPAELAKLRTAVAPVYDWARQQWGEAYVTQVMKAAGH